MKLIEILQGKWLGHPLHPAIVHVPIGGWIAACAFDIAIAAGWSSGGPSRLAFYCAVVGLIGAVIAVPPGIADWLSVKKGKPAYKLGIYHMVLNVLAALVWIGNVALRLSTPEPVTASILATSILGTVLVLVSGYIGSLMVFEHGVSVARLSKKTWRERAARGGARLPDES